MVDLNNMEQVNKMTESCQILSDTLDLVEKYIIPDQSVLELALSARDSPTREASSVLLIFLPL